MPSKFSALRSRTYYFLTEYLVLTYLSNYHGQCGYFIRLVKLYKNLNLILNTNVVRLA